MASQTDLRNAALKGDQEAKIELLRKQCRHLKKCADKAAQRGDWNKFQEWIRALEQTQRSFPDDYVKPAFSDF